MNATVGCVPLDVSERIRDGAQITLRCWQPFARRLKYPAGGTEPPHRQPWIWESIAMMGMHDSGGVSTGDSASARDERSPALWRELRDGSAGAGVRIAVSLAAGLLLAGVGCVLAYVLSTALYRTSYIREEIGIGCFIATSALFAFVLVGVWSRYGRSRQFWYAAVATVATWTVALSLCVGTAAWLRGDEEILVTGIVLLAAGVTLVIWLQSWRWHAPRRPLYTNDGTVDLRCPECGYRLVGLTEARCPECGQQYTLDNLIARQQFAGLPSAPGQPPSEQESAEGVETATTSRAMQTHQ